MRSLGLGRAPAPEVALGAVHGFERHDADLARDGLGRRLRVARDHDESDAGVTQGAHSGGR